MIKYLLNLCKILIFIIKNRKKMFLLLYVYYFFVYFINICMCWNEKKVMEFLFDMKEIRLFLLFKGFIDI